MPRYRYKCHACKTEQMIFHRIAEIITTCPLCKIEDKIQKMLTTPNIKTSTADVPNVEVGQVTIEHIEANREILKQQIQEAKEEKYEPS
jgi:putative FmdB family regulatory protein